ncbi:ribosomal protein L2 (apicoplast) [Toxoplasma gondii TgCatPRC2]|uniref:Ribosomal protein L2 n=12 Tax=Toxoplasma gondii TaxID=5811 RepID=S7UFT1_TOXGG|nr:ribosomal protein L2 [Toxoplasma gondii GT1]EPT24400.1 ribosomal protein L2 [Toxoplasma gondii ME49]KAF4646380.1 ribosomal protein L2 [Toxoplasma gondii]KFG27525.1 ribosomal protein L2 [Toxoplasma gondii p89]KFG49810.1 ribosomal protein L2 [Toxoplasma gondii RUB]KFG99141.1 ribosomal protein L2 [Toxoplasma gondii VAND]KYK53896.1 ribosomal protein L2 [Toxoplasma gondii TgCatPRC2]
MILTFIKIKKYRIKYLIIKKQKAFGRNNLGFITCRAKGGGIKRNLYKILDSNFANYGMSFSSAFYINIIYDSFRRIFLAVYFIINSIIKNIYRYFLLTKNLKIGSQINFGFKAPLKIGNALPLYKILLGSFIYNIEIRYKGKGSLVKNANHNAIILMIGDIYVTVKLPSGEIKLLLKNLFCILGQLEIRRKVNKNIKKHAGFNRKLSIRPKIRGAAMNAVDHPHGGGEGKASVGFKFARTLWGKAFKGIKTRKKNKHLSRFILQHRL